MDQIHYLPQYLWVRFWEDPVTQVKDVTWLSASFHEYSSSLLGDGGPIAQAHCRVQVALDSSFWTDTASHFIYRDPPVGADNICSRLTH
tara:strand:- start:128 stop:394 length:267 start_codon:yes stop_codon:yes gene_type:complete